MTEPVAFLLRATKPGGKSFILQRATYTSRHSAERAARRFAQDGDTITVVPVVEAPAIELTGNSVRINITMPEDLVSEIDKIAPNRSAFLAAAVTAKLKEEQ